mgnify:CR=1 FL=1
MDIVGNYLQKHLPNRPDDEIEFVIEKLQRRPDTGLLRDICYKFHQKFSKKVIILLDNVEVPFHNYVIKMKFIMC